jgi:hypothetical protein
MNIGILTFHFGYNYGGVLQAYALQKYLQSLNYKVEIINYIPPEYNEPSLLFGLSFKKPIETIKALSIKLFHQNESIKAFDSFRNKFMALTEKITDEKKLAEKANNYDTIIVGSDQIWNPSQHNKPIYFLNWYPLYKGKKISYAPCCAVNKIKNIDAENLKKALNDFSFISVRNKTTFDFVKYLTGKEPPIVLDPTFLWDFAEFNNNEPIIKGEYILTYILGSDIPGSNLKTIEKIKEIYGNMHVYAINIAAINPKKINWADKILYNISPDDWINLIANAKFFYTDSFHGLIFALKYHTPFLAYYTEAARASRFIDLQERFDLKNAIIESYDDLPLPDKIDYELLFKNVESILIKEIESSKMYLNKALDNSY